MRCRKCSQDRRRARPAATEDESAIAGFADGKPGPEAHSVARGEAKRIAECFDLLEPARAGAVRGAYLSGLSYQELSRHYDVPVNTVRTWLRRGLQKLKECLEA